MDQKDCLGATAPADGFRCPSLHVAQASASQDQGSYKNFYAEFIRLQAYFTIHIFLLATELSSRVSNYHQTKNLISNLPSNKKPHAPEVASRDNFWSCALGFQIG
jgi:hypothetical protein